MTKAELETQLVAVKAEIKAAEEKASTLQAELYTISEAEQRAYKKANSGTRIIEVQTDEGVVFTIGRGSYLEHPKYFSFYSDGQPQWNKSWGAWGARKYNTREAAETELQEIRKAEKENRLARKQK